MIIKHAGEVYLPIEYKAEKELQEIINARPELLLADNDAPKLHSIGREVSTEAGPIDVLLIEETGKLVIVEVKLAKNGDIRRRVVAQIIDYVSALSRYTYFELDEATGGELTKYVSTLPDSETFKKLVENNLRSGKVRLVVTVDESNDDLLRIVQFISDHTDFEIDVVEVKKYLLGDEPIYDSNIVMKGREASTGQKRIEYNFEILDELTNQWNNNYNSYPMVRDSRYHYRQIRFDNWPAPIHYEFLKSSTNDYLEIRLDCEISPRRQELHDQIRQAMSEFEGKEVNGYTIEMLRNRVTKLVIKVDEKDIKNNACDLMAGLINLTHDHINQAIESYKSNGIN